MLRTTLIPALALAAALAGCAEDEYATTPDLSNNNGLFRRYVSVGTSIGSGLQSGGINDSTQAEAFPVLIAQAANAPFAYPALAGNGCPAPIVNNTTNPVTRVGNQAPGACDLRQQPLPDYLNNIAVPGMWAIDLFSNTASPLNTYERLQLFFLGGQVPIQALMNAQPTLVTVEVGANEFLASLLASNPGIVDSIYPVASFEAAYRRLADSLDKTGAHVVVYDVPDVTVIPYASAGQTWWCLKTGVCPGVPTGGFPANFQVANSCAPRTPGTPTAKGDSILVPWSKGIPRLVAALQNPGLTITLDCAQDTVVVTPTEFAALRNAKVAYNDVIRNLATERGWDFVSLDAILQERRASGFVPLFPDLSQALTGGPVRFGPYFSLDGFHPAGPAHRLIADSTIAILNRSQGTNIPLVGP